MRKDVTGRLWSIDYRGYCPAGWPVRLAEMFVPGGGSRPPAEILGVRHTLGSGYGLTCQHVAPPPRQIGQENLADRRQKRAARRIERSAPLFAEQFLAEELAAKPDYYAGVTDPEIAAKHDAVLAAEGRRYEELLSRPNRLVVLAEEPEAAREKAARIREELVERGERGRGEEGERGSGRGGHGPLG